jgi:vacuolar protein sorting-associated protein 53
MSSLFNKLQNRSREASESLAKMGKNLTEKTKELTNSIHVDTVPLAGLTVPSFGAAPSPAADAEHSPSLHATPTTASTLLSEAPAATAAAVGAGATMGGANGPSTGPAAAADAHLDDADSDDDANSQPQQQQQQQQQQQLDDDESPDSGHSVAPSGPGGGGGPGASRVFEPTKGSSVHVEKFGLELQAAISSVLPPEDALDDPEFNSVAYINSLFPTEQSLADIDTALSRVRVKVSRLDADILGAVREQTSAADDGRLHLQTAQQCVKQLFGKVRDIRTKAEANEAMVAQISRDIVQLDNAKKNLTGSITALKRLQMLTDSIAQLRSMQRLRQYDESSKMLGAVVLFVKYFEDYNDVAQVKALKDDVDELCASFKQQIYGEFETLVNGREADQAARDAPYVIEALGAQARTDFLQWFCNKQLGDYEASFSIESDAYALERTPRRFEWWLKLMETYEQRWLPVFPKEWSMDERLAEEFCMQTKLSIAANLQEHRERLDVTVLVAALQQCLGFEKTLCERFAVDEEVTEAEAAAAARAVASGLESGDEDDAAAAAGDAELDDEAIKKVDEENPHTVDAVRRRYERFKRDRARAERAASKTRAQAKRREEKFAGMISSAFHPYLDLYIAQEEKQLSELLDKLVAQEKWEFDDAGAKSRVLQSATDIAYYFKKCRTRCAALNKGQTLYELFLLLRRTLLEYGAYLARQLPSDLTKPLTLDDERRFCIVINTADYCAQSATRVADGFKKLILPKFHAQLDVTSVQTEFASVVAKATKALVAYLSSLLAAPLLTMQKLPWASWDSVGDTSEYVADIARVIVEHVPTYNLYLSEQHSKYLAEQVVSDLVPRLTQSIYKAKRINEAGAQHLLLDMSVVKTTLLRLPELGQPLDESGDAGGADDDDPDSAKRAKTKVSRYAKFVTKAMHKVEVLLKLLLAPNDMMLPSFKQMTGEFGSDVLHSDDLQRIMELKGVRETDQQSVMRKLESMVDDPRVTSRIKKLFTVETNFGLDRFKRTNTAAPVASSSSAAAPAAKPPASSK